MSATPESFRRLQQQVQDFSTDPDMLKLTNIQDNLLELAIDLRDGRWPPGERPFDLGSIDSLINEIRNDVSRVPVVEENETKRDIQSHLGIMKAFIENKQWDALVASTGILTKVARGETVPVTKSQAAGERRVICQRGADHEEVARFLTQEIAIGTPRDVEFMQGERGNDVVGCVLLTRALED